MDTFTKCLLQKMTNDHETLKGGGQYFRWGRGVTALLVKSCAAERMGLLREDACELLLCDENALANLLFTSLQTIISCVTILC